MKKTQYTLLIALSAFFYILTGCKPATPAVPVTDLLKNSYVAASVNEGATTVYTSGGTANTKPGYAQFRLNLSNPPAVTYTAVDGTVYTGTYAIVGDNQLVLSGLTSSAGPPTSTNGTITFTISDIGDGSAPTFTRTSGDAKTGNTTNVYKLKKG